MTSDGISMINSQQITRIKVRASYTMGTLKVIHCQLDLKTFSTFVDCNPLEPDSWVYYKFELKKKDLFHWLCTLDEVVQQKIFDWAENIYKKDRFNESNTNV